MLRITSVKCPVWKEQDYWCKKARCLSDGCALFPLEKHTAEPNPQPPQEIRGLHEPPTPTCPEGVTVAVPEKDVQRYLNWLVNPTGVACLLGPYYYPDWSSVLIKLPWVPLPANSDIRYEVDWGSGAKTERKPPTCESCCDTGYRPEVGRHCTCAAGYKLRDAALGGSPEAPANVAEPDTLRQQLLNQSIRSREVARGLSDFGAIFAVSQSAERLLQAAHRIGEQADEIKVLRADLDRERQRAAELDNRLRLAEEWYDDGQDCWGV